MWCFKLQNAASFWGLSPQAHQGPKDSTIRANQKWKKTNTRLAKCCVFSRQLQMTSSLPLHSQRQCLIWICQKQKKTSEKWCFKPSKCRRLLTAKPIDLQDFAPGNNLKGGNWCKLVRNVVSQVFVGICPSAGFRPYPITKSSASELVKSSIKQALNVLNVMSQPSKWRQLLGLQPIPQGSALVNNQNFKETNENLRKILFLNCQQFYALCHQHPPDYVPNPFIKELPRNMSEAAESLC